MPKSSKPPRKKQPHERKPRTPSTLETKFVVIWSEVAKDSPKLTTLEAEVKLPPRKFSYDYKIAGTNILVECNGGTWARKRLGHSSAEGIARDYEKANYAQMKGWQVFSYDTKQVNESNIRSLYEYVCCKFPHLC